MADPAAPLPVWDPLIRIGHWLLVCLFTLNYLTDQPLALHVWAGYGIAAIVALRVIWGLVGPERARFSDFVRGPRAVLGYLGGLVRLRSPRYLGHSPAGGAMVVALLVMLSVTTLAGMAHLAERTGTGPLSGLIARKIIPPGPDGRPVRPQWDYRGLHELTANLTLALVILHVCGVALASAAHRENLVRAMIDGRKRAGP
jgi:cytochrome b